MPRLILGPLLRYVGETEATVWVQTDAPCEVSVLGVSAQTLALDGHHFALVVIQGLSPACREPYEVALDGETVWPEPGSEFPPCILRTFDRDAEIDLVFGSCRVTAPHEPPFLQEDRGAEEGRGIDALRALALRMSQSPAESWPDALLMLGDQIYADDLSPDLYEATASQPDDDSHPDHELGGFDDYVLAYREAWSEPHIRWLLSVLPSAMIFDDHEIHAEWKISQAWIDRMREHAWYDDRISGGLAAYWIYQHLGNLSPSELNENELLRRVRAQEDAGALLRAEMRNADRQPGHSRWSFCRDLGRSRLVVIDSRAGRELAPGRRAMIDDGEWEWVERQVTGDFDHILLASSVPFFMVHGLHRLEQWNEAVCEGAWGSLWARLGEKIRQGAVLDHWASFGASFRRLAGLLDELSSGARGTRPRAVVMLSGDVHHCYLAEVGFPRGSATERAPVFQAVCSPYRKELGSRERSAMKFGEQAVGAAIGKILARSAGVESVPIGWRLCERPSYDNQLGTLNLAPGGATLCVETTVGSHWREPCLREVFSRCLTGGAQRPGVGVAWT